MFCMCYVVFRECARATQVVVLASAELYVYMYLEAAGCELWWRVLGAILKSYTGVILTCTWSCTWKQLNVNCGAIYVIWRL